MTEQLQLRRGPASQVSAFTGAAGECVVDTTNNRLVVNDGTTVGGWAAAKLGEVITNTRTAVSDTAYAALASDRLIAYTAITAARVVTLPAASAYPTGTQLTVIDESGNCSASLTITLNHSGSDAINGATPSVISAPYGHVSVESNGSNAWTVIGYALTGNFLTSGGYVNKFRNPSFDVAQRGASGSVAGAATAYTIDGWMVAPTGSAGAWSQVFNGNIAGNVLRLTGASGNSAMNLLQRIESFISAQLLTDAGAAQAITVQFAIYNNSGGSITPHVSSGYASAQDNFATVSADLASTAMQTIANASLGVVAYTFTPTAAGLKLGYQILLALGAITSGYVDIGIADVRATPGVSTGQNNGAPQPELRPISAEMALNQRYFWQNTPGVAFGSFGIGFATASGAALMALKYPETMRAPPALSQSASELLASNSTFTFTAFGTSYIGANSASVGITSTGAGFTVGAGVMWTASSTSAWVAGSAEL